MELWLRLRRSTTSWSRSGYAWIEKTLSGAPRSLNFRPLPYIAIWNGVLALLAFGTQPFHLQKHLMEFEIS